MTTLDTDRLLLSNRQVQVKSEPFKYGYVDEFLHPNTFDELNAHFPDDRVTFVSNGGRPYADYVHPVWAPLLDFLASARFLRDLDKLLGGILGPAPEDRFFLRYMLSRMKTGEWVDPHTDKPTKVITFILYFGSRDWKSEYGGGTEIYEPKFRLLRRNLHSIEMPFEWMKRRDTIAFIPNRLSFVVKAANSWHGVAPIKCPESMSRNRLRFTLEYIDPVETAFEHRARRFVRRRARWAIARWMGVRRMVKRVRLGPHHPPSVDIQ